MHWEMAQLQVPVEVKLWVLGAFQAVQRLSYTLQCFCLKGT